MRRLALPFVLAVLALALAATGCGSSELGSSGSDQAAPAAEGGGVPDGADFLATAVEAGQGLDSAHYILDASVTLTGSSPQLAFVAQGPITLHLEGDASETAFTAEGSVGFAGQTFTGNLLAGEHEVFLNFMGKWYGTKDAGLADAAEQRADGTVSDPQEAIQAVREHFGDVLTGEVSEGPAVDGVETWRFEGTLNAAGIVGLAQDLGGKDMTAEETAQLQAIADAATVVVDFGRGDSLPRHLEFQLSLGADELAELSDGASLDGVESFDMSVTVDLSDFGKDVSFEAPDQFAPFEDLFGQLFGIAMALQPAA